MYLAGLPCVIDVVSCWSQAYDVLYTDLMSLMYPDDNTHSLMLDSSVLNHVLLIAKQTRSTVIALLLLTLHTCFSFCIQPPGTGACASLIVRKSILLI